MMSKRRVFNEHPQLAKLSKNEYVREVKYDEYIQLGVWKSVFRGVPALPTTDLQSFI